jgi:hypothetical protein
MRAAADNAGMHLIVAWAGQHLHATAVAPSPWTTQTPALAHIASTWHRGPMQTSAPGSYNMPHEWAWARACGACTDDGLVPYAQALVGEGAHLSTLPDAQQPREGPRGLLTLTHWQVTPNGLIGAPPSACALTTAEHAALLDAIEPWLRGDGFALHRLGLDRTVVHHEALATLRTASLDRLTGEPMHQWIAQGPLARRWQQLQNELQMVLHDHPVNDERAARGALPVNSVVLSGTGPPAPAAHRTLCTIDDRLVAAGGDPAARAAAWQDLDAERLQPLLESAAQVQLTLAGRLSSVTFTAQPTPNPSGLSRWIRRARGWGRGSKAAQLERVNRSLSELLHALDEPLAAAQQAQTR